jgi:hypothetical protein
MEFKLCPPHSAGWKGGRPREEKQIKGAIECTIDKKETKKKLLETQKKNRMRAPIELDDLVEYRSIKKKQKKEDKNTGKAMGKTVGKGAKGKGMGLREKGESRRVAIRRR